MSQVRTFPEALLGAEPRPIETQDGGKKNYAERLSNKIAVLIANKLRDTRQFPGILPNPDGSGRETLATSGSHKKQKKTDVNYSTAHSGLELLVSIKTLNFRDRHKRSTGGVERIEYRRYTRNMVRNDHELRAEAMDHHERHPFAVLAALFFLPITACDDGESDKSSFAHAVMTFRYRAGRDKPSDPSQFFERFYIGLYEHQGPDRGDVIFFDVMNPPPKRGRPTKNLMTLDQVVAEIVKAYGIRNRRYIVWEEDQSTDSAAIPQLTEPVDSEGHDTDDESGNEEG